MDYLITIEQNLSLKEAWPKIYFMEKNQKMVFRMNIHSKFINDKSHDVRCLLRYRLYPKLKKFYYVLTPSQ